MRRLYAQMPYTGTNLGACGVSQSPNGDIDADSTINVLSHEHIESVTDPTGQAWWDNGGAEIGEVNRIGLRLKAHVGDDDAWFREWAREARKVADRVRERIA